MIYELSNDISCKDMKGLFLMYDGSKGAKVDKKQWNGLDKNIKAEELAPSHVWLGVGSFQPLSYYYYMAEACTILVVLVFEKTT